MISSQKSREAWKIEEKNWGLSQKNELGSQNIEGIHKIFNRTHTICYDIIVRVWCF